MDLTTVQKDMQKAFARNCFFAAENTIIASGTICRK
jgi:hypothetical protein